MRVVIDLQPLQTESAFRGIGRYSLSFVRELLRYGNDDDFILMFNDQAKVNCNNNIMDELIQLVGKNNVVYFPTYENVNFLTLSEMERKHVELIREQFIDLLTPDVLLVTSLFETDAVTSIQTKNERSYLTVAILYDLIPIDHEEQYLADIHVKEWYYSKIEHLKKADCLLAISQFSLDDAVKKIGINPEICINISGASDLLDNQKVGNVSSSKKGLSNFVLYVGGYDSRKNIDKLIEAFASQPLKIKDKYSLVLAGKTHEVEKEKLETVAKSSGLSLSKLVFLGYVEDSELIELYKTCSVFVFPSSNEGFGLPPLEAMGFGAPVIASDKASLPEVVGNSEFLFSPDTKGISAKLEEALTDETFRIKLVRHSKERAKLFSWGKVAKTAYCFIKEKTKELAPKGNVKSHEEAIECLARICSEEEHFVNVSKLYVKLHTQLKNKTTMPQEFIMTDLFKGAVPDFTANDSPYVFSSGLCREQHFHLPLYTYWCKCLDETPKLHRKQWEFVYICQVLHERGYLRAGISGVGFGVGKEPLVPYFASQGLSVLATDLDLDRAIDLGWTNNDEHCDGILALNEDGLCEPELFLKNTKFKTVDMNNIDPDLGKFDFCWSSCAFEHLGSIRKGLDFVLNSVKLLNPGGVAVHTTEFNITSNERTLDNNPTFVIFRKRDIKELVQELTSRGYEVAPVDFSSGEDELERYVDLPPYIEEPHLRLQLAGEFTATSLGLIIKAPEL